MEIENLKKDPWFCEVVSPEIIAKMEQREKISIDECFSNPKKYEEEQIIIFYKKMNNLIGKLLKNPAMGNYNSSEANDLGDYLGKGKDLLNKQALQEGIEYARDCLVNSLMNPKTDYFVSQNFETGLSKLIDRGEKIRGNLK